MSIKRSEQARMKVREISLEFAQDLGLVPRAHQKSIKWTWEDPGKYREYNIARRREIVEQYCSDKELHLCIFPEDIVVAAADKRLERDER